MSQTEAGPVSWVSDEHSIKALREGCEQAFESVVARYHRALVRLARSFVRDQSVAEDVAQETWLAVLNGLSRFEGRSRFRTWLFRILANRARSAARREGRSVAFSNAFADDEEAALGPERFQHPLAPGHWTEPVRSWSRSPEDQVLDAEALAVLKQALEELPPAQRSVVTLRDVEGWDADEVCNVLGISGVHQRVLLHRARTRARHALERYFDRESG